LGISALLSNAKTRWGRLQRYSLFVGFLIVALCMFVSCVVRPVPKPAPNPTTTTLQSNWPAFFNGEYVTILGTAIQPNGNVLVTGAHYGVATICGASTGFQGQYHAFLANLSPAGHCLWVTRRTRGDAYGRRIAVAPSGEIYWAGEECNECRPGNLFLERLDPQGRTEWNLSASALEVSPTALIVTDKGPALSLRFRGTLTIRGSDNSYELETNDDHDDASVLQFLSDGVLTGLTQFGGPDDDLITALAPLPNGQLLATGEVAATTICDRPAGSPPATDAFVARFKDGKLENCRVLRARNDDSTNPSNRSRGEAIATDPFGSFVVAGTYRGDFPIADPDPPWHHREDTDIHIESNSFVASYNALFWLHWAQRVKHDGTRPSGVAIDGREVIVTIETPAQVLRYSGKGEILWSRWVKESTLEVLSASSCGTILVAGSNTCSLVQGDGPRRQCGFASIINRKGLLEDVACRRQ